jgi:peptide deformylase
MIRTIVKYPSPELEKVCAPVVDFNNELKELAGDMLETMYAAPGIGLAAPQVGVSTRLIVLDLTSGQENGHQMVLVNPEVVEESGKQKEEEGCLSLPNLTAVVARPAWVRVKAQDLDGNEFEVEGEDLLARALCHEIDHLEGIVYLDRLSVLKRDLLKRKIKKLIRAGEW